MSNTLHVYTQSAPHDSLFICGTRESLEKLRETLDNILTEDLKFGVYEEFANDGEGYNVHIDLLSEEKMEQMTVPYSDEIFWNNESNKTKVYPWYL
jgi:hypothetical protein